MRGRRAASLTSPHSGATAPLQCAHRVMIPNQLFTVSPRESEEEIGSQNQKETEDNLSGTKSHPSWDFLWFMEQQLPPCVAAQQPKNFPRGEEIPQGFTLPAKPFDILLSWTPTSTKSYEQLTWDLHRNANAHQRDSLKVVKAGHFRRGSVLSSAKPRAADALQEGRPLALCHPHQLLPVPPASCELLRSLASPLALGLALGAAAVVALGSRLPGTFTVVLSRSISFPWTFCM